MTVWENPADGTKLIYHDGWWYFQFANGYEMNPINMKRVLETLAHIELGVIV